ncbi:MAPEG family protein [Tropicibacter sp. R15_0]|uniref:MAPEG family protein n=1 Tax=Tropicibacter sp. R15_0 TaxID=2821101 RepID=UPI001ADBBE4D|nr:MAPEG family protein [Tropicibacter sp. R15_0]MBO9467134.1 MAPEG family protein [Tropicibacter sp. R15_0]
MTPLITLYFVAGFALMHVVITMLVGAARVPNQIHFYDEGDLNLRRNQRAHANFCETVPMALITMAAAETSGTPASWIITGGLVIVAGRLLHYYIIRVRGWGNARAVSMLMTLMPIVGFAGLTLWNLSA